MIRFSRYGWWSVTLGAMIVLAVASRPRSADSMPPARSLDDWSMGEMVEHLNRMGVRVQLRSTQADGALGSTVFLTTIDKDWHSLNSLNKDPRRIREWRGILYCERAGENSDRVVRLWGDRCLAVGPFLFYGDAELLQRVRVALAPFAPAVS